MNMEYLLMNLLKNDTILTNRKERLTALFYVIKSLASRFKPFYFLDNDFILTEKKPVKKPLRL